MSDMNLGGCRRSRWFAIWGTVCGLALSGAAGAQVTVGYQMSTGAVAPHPSASVGDGTANKILGGGALVNYTGAGNLLVNSAPFEALETHSTGWWNVSSRDHEVADPSSITAFALVMIDPMNQYAVQEFRSAPSAVAPHPMAAVTIPPGWVLTGGGCEINNPDSAPGNMLTGSYPAQQQLKGGRLGPYNQWVCTSKDHDIPNPASITAIAVAVAPMNPATTPLPVMCVARATSAVSQHPTVQVQPNCGRGLITGGGALAQPTDPNGNGLLLTAMFPNFQGPQPVWEARAKDHMVASPGTVTGFVIVVDLNPSSAVTPPNSIQQNPYQKVPGAVMVSPPAGNPGGMTMTNTPPPAAPTNGGQCVIDINGMGYTQHEVQRWVVNPQFTQVGAAKHYPMNWSTSGSGSYTTSGGSTTWTINAGANLTLSTFVLPSGTWLIQQVETGARVAGGITGTQQLNGQQPTPVGAEAFEYMYPAISAPGTATHVDSSTTFPVDSIHKWGFMQPAGPTGTIACEWHVNP